MKPGLLASGMLMLFWGMLIVVIDIEVNQFDLVLDLLGWLMILAGLSRVRFSHREAGCDDAISFCQLIALIALAVSLVPKGAMPALAGFVFGALQLLACMTFCRVMVRRMRAAEWIDLVRRWQVVRGWILFCWCVPYALTWLFGMSFGEVDINAPILVVPMLAIFFVPMIVTLIAMHATRNHAVARLRELRRQVGT